MPTTEVGELVVVICGAVRQRDVFIAEQGARSERLRVVVATLLEIAERDQWLDPLLVAPCRALHPGDLARCPVEGARDGSQSVDGGYPARPSRQRAMVAGRIATMQQGARTDLASIEATSQVEGE